LILLGFFHFLRFETALFRNLPCPCFCPGKLPFLLAYNFTGMLEYWNTGTVE
jgi:hypothetical protein